MVANRYQKGPLEGRINRLKMLKRQMYGRARLDLLARAFSWRPDRRLDIDQFSVT